MLQTEYAVDRGGGGGGTAAGNDLSWYLSRILWFKVQRKLLQVVVLAVLEPVGGELAVDKQMSQSRQVYQQIAKDVHVPLSIRIAVDYPKLGHQVSMLFEETRPPVYFAPHIAPAGTDPRKTIAFSTFLCL